MRLFPILSVFYVLLPLAIFSQGGEQPSPEDIELATSLSEKYPEDNVAILQNVQEISFGFNKKTKKVTVESNYQDDFINLKSRSQVPLVVFYDDQSIAINLRVLNKHQKPQYQRFEDDPYNMDGLFHNDANIRWTNLNFPLFGSRSTFKYKKIYKDVKYFVSTYLADMHPSVSRTVIVKVPDWLDLEIKEFNFEGYTVEKSQSRNDKKKTTDYTYTIKEVPASKNDDNSPGPTYTRPHLLFLTKSYNRDGASVKLFNETKDLYAWYHSLINQMNDDPSVLEDKTLRLIKDCKSDEEKIKSIFYWVQDNIRYIAFEDGIAGFKPDESQNVYKKKYGDCKGMANLTKQMLKIAGFDARLAWIGTKRIAYDYSLPTIAVDNHMICAVINEGNTVFLDATESYNPLGSYAERIQSKQVMIENGEGFMLDSIPSDTALKNAESFIAELKIEEEKLIGSVTRKYIGQSKTAFLNGINSLQTDKRDDALASFITLDNKNLSIENVKVTDINDRDGDLVLEYTMNLKNAVSSFSDDIYIDIDFYKEYKDLDLKKRTDAYLFHYKSHETTTIDLLIPDGYRVQELPSNLAIDNADFNISFAYKEVAGKITYEKVVHFKNGSIAKEKILAWREFYPQLKSQYLKQIILTKK